MAGALGRFSEGEFKRTEVGRELFDFIAMHYVRSQACRLQIEHLLKEFPITHAQAEAEFKRLTLHQDVWVFRDLVDGVSRTLTHYVIRPIVNTGSWGFVTSDKVMYADGAESRERETFVWFPLSPSTGLFLISEGHSGQVLGPLVEVDRPSGRIRFLKLPESPVLRCYEPEPQEGNL